jgi:proteic killer suppression protein
MAIQSFADPVTRALYHGFDRKARRVPSDVRRRALRKLAVRDAAGTLEDLRCAPGNRLELLRGSKDPYSIRVNDQWRIVFLWTKAGPADVSLLDYH